MQNRRFSRSSLRSLAPFSMVLAGLAIAGTAGAAGFFESDGLGMTATNPMARVIPGPEVRWQSSMAAFAASDRDHAPVTDGVIFVGSSTIRFWSHLAQDFRQMPVINRGFGGSTMADCQYFARQLVLQYKPRQVFVYAGDNDIAEGRSPQQVLESFRGFVEIVRKELPDTRITYISIKPSPSRATLMPKFRESNALVQGYIKTLPNAAYIDVFSAMLDSAGNPREDLFRADRLHMNDSGYALWASIVGPYLQPAAGSVVPTEVAAPVAQPIGAPSTPAAAVAAPAVHPPLNAMRAVYRP